MPRYQGEFSFRHDLPPKLGILLVNLGSPDKPTATAVRRYLKQFLWDPRVVEIPRPAWWLILNLLVLKTRPKKSAALYQSIWTEKGSPLLVHSHDQAKKLDQALQQQYTGRVVVELGMRYGNPSIESALDNLHSAGARRLLVLPLYPQYSATSTGSVFDEVTAVLQRRRWIPDFRFISHYHDVPEYLETLAQDIQHHWKTQGRSEHLLLSYHGIPKRCLTKGDPYYCECQKTSRLLAEALGLKDDQWTITFQSRFGREEWLKPYTEHTLRRMGKKGLASVDVVCPGFSADCLETLEEIEMTNREAFVESGGGDFTYIPALNAKDRHIQFLKNLVERHSQGWPDLAAENQQKFTKTSAEESLQHAQALGAKE